VKCTTIAATIFVSCFDFLVLLWIRLGFVEQVSTGLMFFVLPTASNHCREKY